MNEKGKVLEQQILNACDWYAARGIAVIQFIPTPWQPKRQGGRIVGAYVTEKSTVDFLGVIGNGRGIALEAKEEQCDRINKARVKPHQVKFLKTYKACGGAAVVVVGFWTYNRFFEIDIDNWDSAQTLSFSIDDCNTMGREIFLVKENKYLDFLVRM